MLGDITLMVKWSATIALETAYAGSLLGITQPPPPGLEDALDWLHDECSTRAWMLGWQETDLPLPPGNLP